MIDKNSLILSMGHPVKDRLSRLSRRPKLRSGGALASLALSAFILSATSFANAKSTDFPKNAVAPILTSLIDGQEYTIQGKPFSLKYVNVRRKKATAVAGALNVVVYSTTVAPREKIVGADTKVRHSFPPMHHSDRCVRHIAQNNSLPFWYKETGAVVTSDKDGDVYMLTCLPGTDEDIKAMSVKDFINGLNASPDLSAKERLQLASMYKGGAPKTASIILR